jgi:hypothetical protein
MGTINNGDLHAKIINQAAGDMYNAGGQHVTVVTPAEARQAVSQLRNSLTDTTLDKSTATQARGHLAEIDTAMQATEPAKSYVASLLEQLTRLLKEAGCLATASSALISPLHTLATWLGTLGDSIYHMLPVFG